MRLDPLLSKEKEEAFKALKNLFYFVYIFVYIKEVKLFTFQCTFIFMKYIYINKKKMGL